MKDFDYFAPQEISEAVSLMRQYGDQARLLAGGTDLFLRLEHGLTAPGMIIDLKKIVVAILAAEKEK